MGATSSGLDGRGLLDACAPMPTGASIIKAHVIVNGVPGTQYLLCLATPTGAHVTYWEEAALIALRDKITETLTGLVIVSDPPARNGSSDDYGN